MGNGIAAPRAARLAGFSPTNLGLVGQVATSWGAAGGLIGAVVVTIHMVLGHLSASIGFLTVTILFVAGSLVGFLHGGIVGYLSRPPHVSRLLALKRVALGGIYAVPAMLLGWMFALSLALTPAALISRAPGMVLLAAMGWVGAGGVFAWAALETRLALPHLFERWPGSRAAAVTLGLLFLALLPFFLLSRPEVWVLNVRPTSTTAAFMALGATAWIGGPLAALGVLTWRAWRLRHPPHRG